ncbi:glutathione peroxidase [Frankia sp. CNm7]|uniref:Glutathione peroxidase n=1 Tax=Frankia nepalensis TaxID=1836974 RepID=A0A937UPC2_9ACTN|nr:glutathione peroxidase [Frankia nepalensis]MBL7495770.1 glutathione peroxidase [Frankia nepalensis]MBL7513013.1 glutathione peroxidase [Frankia nepalensis]MBL7523635.1 glutathione peroxidase [Frankia nepalensis]MBL7627120.1 glutathione peroxidase [Frankia nepalensis]
MTVHDFTATDIDGNERSLKEYAGRPLLIVNVASKCGLTPQYEGLQALYGDLHGRGLEILGFPCNQFAGQEPGTNDEIAQFCSTSYNVSFPLFSKVDVNGPEAHPLFAYLRAQAVGDFGPGSPLYDWIKTSRPEALGTDEVKWNFTKFLVDKDGTVVRRYEPTVLPEEIRPDLDALLGA